MPENKDKCCWPRCRDASTLLYYEKPLCDVHWEDYVGAESNTRAAKARVKIGLPKKLPTGPKWVPMPTEDILVMRSADGVGVTEARRRVVEMAANVVQEDEQPEDVTSKIFADCEPDAWVQDETYLDDDDVDNEDDVENESEEEQEADTSSIFSRMRKIGGGYEFDNEDDEDNNEEDGG